MSTLDDKTECRNCSTIYYGEYCTLCGLSYEAVRECASQRQCLDLQSQLQTKDALIKELLEVVEFYGGKCNWNIDHQMRVFTTIIDDSDKLPCGRKWGGKKARTLLNSEAVKEWRDKK